MVFVQLFDVYIEASRKGISDVEAKGLGCPVAW